MEELGTHTHIQTRDYRILDKGTAYMSDVGMCGPYDSILGVNKDDVITRTWTGSPTVFNVKEDGKGVFSACLLSFDDKNYKCINIRPIYKILEEGEY